jgi:DNA replication protein DnaC
MENQIQNQVSTGIDNQIGSLIGMNKYQHLKSLKLEDLTEDQKSQITAFESKQKKATPEQTEREIKHFERIFQPEVKKEFSITARQLWKLFKANFPEVNKRPFIKIEGVTIKNLEPLIYYFSKDERFFDCENLRKDLSVPSFDKGLLIIGNFGNGKTSTMKVFEKIFKGIPEVGFKGYSANEVVTMFEKCSTDADREYFENQLWRGIRYFDDLKTERIASNFGKVNIFKEIIEERYNRKAKTHVTCNFKKDHPDDINAALDEFEDKYDGRVYDRLFEMYNIIEFKGKSFRK